MNKMKAPDRCPNCLDVGRYAVESVGAPPDQMQCEWCYTTPNSVFNITRQRDALAERVKQLEEALDSLVQYIYRRS
jgi:hypothetical protein